MKKESTCPFGGREELRTCVCQNFMLKAKTQII